MLISGYSNDAKLLLDCEKLLTEDDLEHIDETLN
jgi:hypothetical protein